MFDWRREQKVENSKVDEMGLLSNQKVINVGRAASS